jgi:hypothetical protein
VEDRGHSKFECPNCHSENIQQFELAYESGLSNLGLTTVGGGLVTTWGWAPAFPAAAAKQCSQPSWSRRNSGQWWDPS